MADPRTAMARARRFTDWAAAANLFYGLVALGVFVGGVQAILADWGSVSLTATALAGGLLWTGSAVVFARWTSRGAGSPLLAGLVALAASAIVFTVALRASMTGPMRHHMLSSVMFYGGWLSPPTVLSLLALRAPRDLDWSNPPARRGRSWVAILVLALPLAGWIATKPLGRNYNYLDEASMIGSFRSLTTAQEQFKKERCVDLDQDEIGEYGTFQELSGLAPFRGGTESAKTSPFVARWFGEPDAAGIVRHNGYYVMLYLPEGTDAQEQVWGAYAWPIAAGRTGNRAFFVNQSGEVYCTDNQRNPYSGRVNIPRRESAFVKGSGKDLQGGVALAAEGLTANDGNTWVPAGN